MSRALPLLVFLLGCASLPSPSSPSPSSPSAPRALPSDALEPDPAVHVDEGPGFALTIALSDQALAITTTARGEGLDSWSALPLFEALRAEDARGALAVRASEGRVTFDRAVAPPLRLSYRVPAHGVDRDELAFGEVVRFDGRVLLLPAADSPREITLSIEGEEPARIASTLGLGARRTLSARPIDLRDVTWAIGAVEQAAFEAREGRDVIASLGPRAYELRWAGAEIALLRTRVDGFFGGIDAEPHTTLLLARAPAPAVPPVEVARSGIGLRLLMREDTRWNAEVRLAVAQALARRWLGGALRFTSSEGADEVWASFGITRWIAQEILADMGTLSSEERATDLTRLEGAIATGDERASIMARGALYAAALDARLRARETSLRELLLELLARAEDAQGAALPREAFVTALAARAGREEVDRFAAQVLGGAPVEVAASALGPCLRRGRAVHRRFALGLDPLHAEGEVSGVIPDGPAHRAGLRDGMRASDLRYELGRTDRPARITVLEDAPRAIEWLPFDREVRGLGWRRVAGIPEERCAR